MGPPTSARVFARLGRRVYHPRDVYSADGAVPRVPLVCEKRARARARVHARTLRPLASNVLRLSFRSRGVKALYSVLFALVYTTCVHRVPHRRVARESCRGCRGHAAVAGPHRERERERGEERPPTRACCRRGGRHVVHQNAIVRHARHEPLRTT